MQEICYEVHSWENYDNFNYKGTSKTSVGLNQLLILNFKFSFEKKLNFFMSKICCAFVNIQKNHLNIFKFNKS